jgi:CO/xanthine dehydrogenase FAD-binding subunit
MKPASFHYVRPASVEQAVAALAAGGDAKILAGGQSLVPMLNFRLARPATLVDVNRIEALRRIEESPRGLAIGALVRHRTIETDPLVAERFPVLAAAAREVGHLAIRNRGTFGGALAHNDPAAEFPMIALLLDATLVARSAKGERRIPAADFFVGPLTSALAETELLTTIELPWLPPSTGWGFEELSRRHGDFAIAAAAATVTVKDGRCTEARLALGGVGASAFRARDAERLLAGTTVDAKVLGALSAAASEASDPNGDVHATAEFRRHLAGVLAARAVASAWARATGGNGSAS